MISLYSCPNSTVHRGIPVKAWTYPIAMIADPPARAVQMTQIFRFACYVRTIYICRINIISLVVKPWWEVYTRFISDTNCNRGATRASNPSCIRFIYRCRMAGTTVQFRIQNSEQSSSSSVGAWIINLYQGLLPRLITKAYYLQLFQDHRHWGISVNYNQLQTIHLTASDHVSLLIRRLMLHILRAREMLVLFYLRFPCPKAYSPGGVAKAPVRFVLRGYYIVEVGRVGRSVTRLMSHSKITSKDIHALQRAATHPTTYPNMESISQATSGVV